MLNERFVFLAGLHAFAAAVAVVAHVVQARSRVVFEQTGTVSCKPTRQSEPACSSAGQQQTIPARLTKAGLSRVSAIARMVVITLIAYYSVYIVARKPVLRFIITSSFGAWTRWRQRICFNERIQLTGTHTQTLPVFHASTQRSIFPNSAPPRACQHHVPVRSVGGDARVFRGVCDTAYARIAIRVESKPKPDFRPPKLGYVLPSQQSGRCFDDLTHRSP